MKFLPPRSEPVAGHKTLDPDDTGRPTRRLTSVVCSRPLLIL